MMKSILMASVTLLSLCIALLIGTHSMNIGLYIGLIAIDYVLILCMNADFRKMAKHFFCKKGSFGDATKYYGEVHLETLKEDIEKIDPDAFEYFVGDLFAELGYKIKVTQKYKDFGGDVVAKKGKDTTIIQVKHRNSSDWLVSNDAVQQVVASMPVYKANLSMVVTNGEFTEHAYKQAEYNHTAMIDGKELCKLVRQVILKNKGTIKDKKKLEVEEQGKDANEQIRLEDLSENLGIISKADCLEEKLDCVLSDTILEVTLEERIKEQAQDGQESKKEETTSKDLHSSNASNS